MGSYGPLLLVQQDPSSAPSTNGATFPVIPLPGSSGWLAQDSRSACPVTALDASQTGTATAYACVLPAAP
jgi:hypothetical protein